MNLRLVTLITVLLILASGTIARAQEEAVVSDEPAPLLSLPTPSGETWQVIQGYGCGTHEDWDFYSLDLVHADGETLGAPVRAAATGSLWAWVEPSGTLIIRHSERYYTMYTHMEPFGEFTRGNPVAGGSIVGYVGERGTPNNPHLHFTFFSSEGNYGRDGRRSLPISFSDGYALGEIGGCSQHQGTLLTAQGPDNEATRQQTDLTPKLIEPIFCYGFGEPCKR